MKPFPSIRTFVVVLAAGVILAGCTSEPTASQADRAATTAVTTVTEPGIASTETVLSTVTVLATTTKTAAPTTRTITRTVTKTTSSSRPTSDSPPTGLKVGGSGVIASDRDGEATIEVLTTERTNSSLGEYGDSPTKGAYLVVEVNYECTDGQFDYNPYDWTVRDAEGRSYDQAYIGGFTGDSLNSGTIAKGAKARGTIVFDVPEGALNLEYSHGFGAPAVWDVPA